MKKLNFNDIIRILPLDEAYRQDFLKKYPSYSEDLKFEIDRIIWQMYIGYEKKLIEIKYSQYLQEVIAKKKPLKSNLYDEARQAVWQDFEDILTGKKQETQQIEEIRQKLHSLMQSAPN